MHSEYFAGILTRITRIKSSASEFVLPLLAMRKAVLLLGLCFIFIKIYSQDISSVSLQTLDGKPAAITDIKKNKATVIVFLLADCPACQNYALTLNKMNEKYKADNIEFYGVFPGNYSKPQEL